MRRRSRLRESRLVHAAVGASVLAVPASAAAVSGTPRGAQADGQPATGQTGSADQIQVELKSRKIQYGHSVIVTGRAPSSQAGQSLALDFARSGSAVWRQIASTTVRGEGGFRLVAPLARSGAVRVTDVSPALPLAAADSGSSSASSTPQAVTVASRIRMRTHDIDLIAGQAIKLRGTLLPGGAGRRVRLQSLRAGRWDTLSISWTGADGRFLLRYTPDGTGQQRLRVRFAGDSANAGVSQRAGMLTAYGQSVASWYNDAGTTACGFHAYYGVANLSLPCGTKVSFMYGGRTVTAVVDDRGPYVGGREWDLNQDTAAALGFGGVATVWSSS